MNRLLVTLLLICSGFAQAAGRGFCAVRLTVAWPDGSPISGAIASLVGSDGNVVQTVEVRTGLAEFCDFGFGYYSIRVQHKSSNPVTLYRVRLIYGHTQDLHITLNSSSKGDFGPAAGNACTAYVRVQSTEGEPISSVQAIRKGMAGEADEFGRLLLLVPLKEFVVFRFQSPRFQSHEASFSCMRPEEQIEKTIVLQPENP